MMTKKVIFLLCLQWVFILALSGTSIAKGKYKTAVIVSTDSELKGVMGVMKEINNETKEGIIFISGKIGGEQVIVARSGHGKVNAAYCATLLFDRYDPERLISIGLAGAVNPSLKPGESFIVSRVIEHDSGGLLKGKFIPDDTNGIDTSRLPFFNEAMKRFMGKNISIAPAILLTGDTFISTTAKRNWLKTTYGGDLIDMEGYAIAKVCQNKSKDCIFLRTVSDMADDKAETAYEARKNEYAVTAASILNSILDSKKEK